MTAFYYYYFVGYSISVFLIRFVIIIISCYSDAREAVTQKKKYSSFLVITKNSQEGMRWDLKITI
jgi:hypothetical protein